MLTIHRAARADALVDALAAVLADPLNDAFTPEVVAVPTRGVERWITQRLSTVLGASPGRQDGVCANVDFPFPGRPVGTALAAATDVDPDTDPWLPERSCGRSCRSSTSISTRRGCRRSPPTSAWPVWSARPARLRERRLSDPEMSGAGVNP